MTHEHKHSHCCKHENMKFCKKCDTPYCEDCGKEWFDKCTLSHTSWTYPWYTTATPHYGTTTEYNFDAVPVPTCVHTV